MNYLDVMRKITPAIGSGALDPVAMETVCLWCLECEEVRKSLFRNLGIENSNLTVTLKRPDNAKTAWCEDDKDGKHVTMIIPSSYVGLKAADALLFEAGNAGRISKRHKLKEDWRNGRLPGKAKASVSLNLYGIRLSDIEAEAVLEYYRNWMALKKKGSRVLKDQDNERLIELVAPYSSGDGEQSFKYLIRGQAHDRDAPDYKKMPSMYLYELEKMMEYDGRQLYGLFIDPVLKHWNIGYRRIRGQNDPVEFRKWAIAELDRTLKPKKPAKLILMMEELDRRYPHNAKSGALEFHGISQGAVSITKGTWRYFPDVIATGFDAPPPPAPTPAPGKWNEYLGRK